MNDKFQLALNFVLLKEGGYSDNKSDKGGATCRGVTQTVYDAYRHNLGLPYQSVSLISDDEVTAIYRTQYWNPVHGDNLPEPVDLVVFDAAVNCGVSRSVKWLQQLCNTAQDGMMGPATETAVRAHDIRQLAKDLLDRREDYYHELVDLNPKQGVFLNGWLNRVNALRKLV